MLRPTLARSDLAALLVRLETLFAAMGPCAVACSGGVDSMLLATLAHRLRPDRTAVVHATGPAVPRDATQRVVKWGESEGWWLTTFDAQEFADEAYLRNRVDRCYHCKNRLYRGMHALRASTRALAARPQDVLLSGANVDDLGEYRPGLRAAAEQGVRHPFVEAGLTKQNIRELARALSLPFAELAASPCLASRLYTGTRVTTARLAAVQACEERVRDRAGISIVRCRIRGDDMLVEVPSEHRRFVSEALLKELAQLSSASGVTLASVQLDPQPYRPGRAFVIAS